MNLNLYTKEMSVTLAVFTITFIDDILVQGNNTVTMINVAKHLVTVEINYTVAFQGFREVVVVHPVGKRYHILLAYRVF